MGNTKLLDLINHLKRSIKKCAVFVPEYSDWIIDKNYNLLMIFQTPISKNKISGLTPLDNRQIYSFARKMTLLRS